MGRSQKEQSPLGKKMVLGSSVGSLVCPQKLRGGLGVGVGLSTPVATGWGQEALSSREREVAA